MSLELISFKLCPFVQRSVITLLYKSVDFKLTHIDLSNPPDWFKNISPFGKVPVLRVDDQTTIFESAVINEYLDETTEGRLLPEDPLLRALDRSWIDFGSVAVLDLSGVMHADTKEKYEQAYAQLKNKLTWLNDILTRQPYFNGAEISLVDFAYAPLFMRMDLIGLKREMLDACGCGKVAAWAELLLEMDCVKKSTVPEFKELLFNMIRNKGTYAATQLTLA